MQITEENRIKKVIELTDEDIIDLLKSKNVIPQDQELKNLKIYFEVPTGGDYSGTDIEIDKSTPIKIEIETFQQKTLKAHKEKPKKEN